MSTTWIIIISLVGLIVFVLLMKVIWHYLKKDKLPTKLTETKKTEYGYEISFVKLDSIIFCNNYLQENELHSIGKVNKFIEKQIVNLKNTPEYIFNSHLIEFNNYVIDFVETKLLKNSASVWIKNFNDEINMLHFKTKEMLNKNLELNDYKKFLEDKILKGWKILTTS